jgi:hypothetical protein
MNAPALTPDLTPHDYTLAPGADFAWIHVGVVSVLISTVDGAVVVSAYRQGEDDEAGCVVVPL